MKLVLKPLAGIIALIVIAAIAIPMLVSADYLKAQLQAQVKKATGRELKIEGKIAITLLPSPSVAVTKVTFGNPAGFTTPYFVKMDTLRVGAAFAPLLQKQLRITDITIEGADLNLEEIGNGKKNWDFVSGKKSGANKPQASANNEKTGKAPLVIDGVHIRNSIVNYRKAGTKPMQLATTGINADIAMHDDVVKLTLSHASLYGGTANGTVKKEGSGLAVKMNLSGVKIEPLMVALTGASKFEGVAQVDIDVTGKTGNALMSSLVGSGNIKINDGAIKGINVASFLRDAKKGFVLGNSSSESTDFTEMTASFTIAQGVVSNKDLSMKSPVLRLGGSGSVSLPARTINYRAVPTLVSSLQGQGAKDKSAGLDIPLLITGPWSAISITPDLEGILTNALTNPEALKDNIKGVKEGLKDFNSPKDIGKVLLGGTGEAAPTPAVAPATGAAPVAKPKPAKEQLINDAIGGVLGGFGN